MNISKYIVSFCIFIFCNCELILCTQADPFEQNMQAILQGQEKTQILYNEKQDLVITIQKKQPADKPFYTVNFTAQDNPDKQDEGAYLLVFPTQNDTSLGYLKWLHKISGKYSGTELLEAVAGFCKQMQIKSVILFDESELCNDESFSWISLKKSHILRTDSCTSWYESKGYLPMSEKTCEEWFKWLCQETDLSSLHTFAPIPLSSYRYVAEKFANVDCQKYLESLEQLENETQMFTKQVKTLRKLLEHAPHSLSKDLFRKVASLDFSLQEELLELLEFPISESTEFEFYQKMASNRSEHSANLSYAGILLIQILFRDSFTFQTEQDRKNLLQSVDSVIQGGEFTYKRDMSHIHKIAAKFDLAPKKEKENDPKLIEDDSDDEDKPLIELAIQYLADSPVNLFAAQLVADYSSLQNIKSDCTIREALRLLSIDEQQAFLQEVLFGSSTHEYYSEVCAHIEKLMSSDDKKEFFFGHLLDNTLLDNASAMEQNFY